MSVSKNEEYDSDFDYKMSSSWNWGKMLTMVFFPAETKYFSCRCTRCADPTELGTMFSSIRCQAQICITCMFVTTITILADTIRDHSHNHSSGVPGAQQSITSSSPPPLQLPPSPPLTAAPEYHHHHHPHGSSSGVLSAQPSRPAISCPPTLALGLRPKLIGGWLSITIFVIIVNIVIQCFRRQLPHKINFAQESHLVPQGFSFSIFLGVASCARGSRRALSSTQSPRFRFCAMRLSLPCLHTAWTKTVPINNAT